MTRVLKKLILVPMFSRKKSSKLSSKEVEAALTRIRKGYDDYIISYMAAIDEKSAFEDRYITALHARVDLTRFIKDEIEHLQALTRERENEKASMSLRVKAPPVDKRSFADKIMAELEKKIEKYPEMDIHEEASIEVKKLYGALNELDVLHWGGISNFIRKVYSSTVSYELENRLLRMTTMGEDNVPPELERYLFLLKQRHQYSSELFREAQECIKRASFFLNELKRILEECQDRGLMDENVEIAYKYVENIISDFRLKDLKRF
ncbi:MAG: hypothetical protein PQJ50_12250 [Spirochaetales bacterium]|nr:hypothetical protein [Spirochaetales bacterium]